MAVLGGGVGAEPPVARGRVGPARAVQVPGFVAGVGQRPVLLLAPLVDAHDEDLDRGGALPASARPRSQRSKNLRCSLVRSWVMASASQAEPAVGVDAGAVQVVPGPDDQALPLPGLGGAGPGPELGERPRGVGGEDVEPPADVQRGHRHLLGPVEHGQVLPELVAAGVAEQVGPPGPHLLQHRLAARRQRLQVRLRVGHHGAPGRPAAAGRRCPGRAGAAPRPAPSSWTTTGSSARTRRRRRSTTGWCSSRSW